MFAEPQYLKGIKGSNMTIIENQQIISIDEHMITYALSVFHCERVRISIFQMIIGYSVEGEPTNTSSHLHHHN